MATSTLMKKLSIATAGAAFVGLGTALDAQQAQAYTLFSQRTTFQNALSNVIIDDYESPGYLNGDIVNSPGYLSIHTNDSMNSVFGETKYKTTTPFGQNGYNLIVGSGSSHQYCAGCNGSFWLDFTKTSIGNALGVFAVGFDITIDTDYFAYVIFGDDSSQDISLASASYGFWGITSDKNIKSIHLGLPGGGSTFQGYIVIDNLTIGSVESVPEPASVVSLLALSALGTGSMLKRKQQQKARVKA